MLFGSGISALAGEPNVPLVEMASRVFEKLQRNSENVGPQSFKPVLQPPAWVSMWKIRYCLTRAIQQPKFFEDHVYS